MTATYEGVIGTIALRVELTVDTDGDGIPDDFERLNATNAGGANLARLAGTEVRASSFSSGFPPERAIDGSVQTSWFTAVGDAANKRTTPFIEVTLPQDVNVAQIRLLGNRQNPEGFDFFAGIFQAFNAAGTEVFNSGNVLLPAPTRDVAVPVELDGVRRVRFTSTADESNTPGLSEIQVISRPGGAGLDPNNANDAALDLDGDGLTNLQEFNLGTSIFLNDTDGDGQREPFEELLPGWTIYLDGSGSGLLNGQLDEGELSDVTDAGGSYSFEVGPGTYTVAELLRLPHEQTAPAPSDGRRVHVVTVAQGDIAANKDFGNRLPQLNFEVFRAVDDFEPQVRAVTMIPAAGEFIYEKERVIRIEGGRTVAENLHTGLGGTDWKVSLDQLQEQLPNAGHVSLVVSWFGTDLRIGQCEVKPGVEVNDKVTEPHVWSVGGVTRDEAYVVSKVEERPAYGGTPSDNSVTSSGARPFRSKPGRSGTSASHVNPAGSRRGSEA